MSFQPLVPVGGYAGWSFLTRTRDVQQAAFDASPQIARDTAHFEETIASVRTAEALVNDRQLLSVALGAFGLDEDINNRAFLQKVLEDGTLDPGALANRLADKRYLDFAKAFGFGDFDTPRTVLSEFGAEITDAYRTRQFEAAVGAQDPTMRLALGLDRALDEILATDTTPDGMWYAVMGQPPVRSVFETAFGLPSSFGALDLSQQLTTFREKAQSRLGDREIGQFADPEARNRLLRQFLVQSEIAAAGPVSGPASAALALLQQSASASLFAR